MKLTGAAKEAFEKWYLTIFLGYKDPRHLDQFSKIEMERFHNLSDSMRYGVIVDWGDSVLIYISVKAEGYKPIFFQWNIKNGLNFEFSGNITTRTEARTEAVQKLSELYNNQER